MSYYTNIKLGTKDLDKIHFYLENPMMMGGADCYELLFMVLKTMQPYIGAKAYVEILNSHLIIKLYKGFFATKSNVVAELSVGVNSHWKTIEIRKCSGLYDTVEIRAELDAILSFIREHYSVSMKRIRQGEFFKRMKRDFDYGDFKGSRQYALSLKNETDLPSDKLMFVNMVLRETKCLEQLNS